MMVLYEDKDEEWVQSMTVFASCWNRVTMLG